MKFINLYQIYRPKSKDYPWTSPIPCVNDDVALSSFMHLAKFQPELSSSYIYCIGKMEVKTGKISLKREPRLIKVKSNKVKSNEK